MPAETAAEPQAQTGAIENTGVVTTDAPPPEPKAADAPARERAERNTSILNALGVPAEVQNAVFAESEDAADHSEEGQPEAAEPKTEEAKPEQEQEQDQDQEQEQEPKEGRKEWPPEFKARIDKLTRQKSQERTTREAAEAKVAEYEQRLAQLESAPPVTVAPSAADPLADVQDLNTLAQKVQGARITKKWCRQHPDGVTINEGTEQERVISPEEIAGFLSEAEDVIEEHAPRKAHQLQLKEQNEQIAREKFKPLFDRGSEDYQVAQVAMREIPGLATHPARELFIGYYLKGVRADIAAEAAAKETGKAAAQNGNGHKPDLDPRLTRAHQATIPPLAPVTPRAPSSASTPNGRKSVAEAMQQMVSDGGSREALARAVGAMRKNNDTNPRSAALV